MAIVSIVRKKGVGGILLDGVALGFGEECDREGVTNFGKVAALVAEFGVRAANGAAAEVSSIFIACI